MSSPARIGERLTLEQFLRMPEIDEPPYLEYIDGRVEAKMSPQKKHGRLGKRLIQHIDAFSEPRDLGEAFLELRCTFANRSIVPDVVFLLDEHIETDENDIILNPTPWPPDIHVEIVSPRQSARKCREKLEHSIGNGCPLGWLIDPERLTVHVFRPGERPRRLAEDGVLDGEPMLPGYRLPVTELLGWIKLRRPRGTPASLPPPPESPDDGGAGR